MRKHLVQAVFSVYDLQCSVVTEIDDKTTGPNGLIALIFRSVMSFKYFVALTKSPIFITGQITRFNCTVQTTWNIIQLWILCVVVRCST